MKELRGSAESSVDASSRACFELAAAVDRYPIWNPAIRNVEVLESNADGRPTRVRTVVNVAAGPISRDFDLVMAVEFSGREAVSLSRVPHEPGDPEKFEVVWRIAEDPTSLQIELTATLEVPRLMPVGGIGDRLAQEFIADAKRELERSSPKASASSS